MADITNAGLAFHHETHQLSNPMFPKQVREPIELDQAAPTVPIELPVADFFPGQVLDGLS